MFRVIYGRGLPWWHNSSNNKRYFQALKNTYSLRKIYLIFKILELDNAAQIVLSTEVSDLANVL